MKMNAIARRLLLQSIDKWALNASAEEPNDARLGSPDCPLCSQFWEGSKTFPDGGRCKGCPVFEKTGKPFCEDSPYAASEEAHFAWIKSFHVDDPEDQERKGEAFRESAEKELLFLKSLL